MPTRIQNTLRLLGKQIHDLRFLQLSRHNSIQRTESTWARVIRSFEGLPEPYWETARSLLDSEREFPYTVLTPAYETFRTRVSEKLVWVMDCEVCVLERSGRTVTAVCYPIDEIQYVEVSSMLLDYRVRIHGLTSQGILTSSIFRCSTATDYLFRPILRGIRLRGTSSQDTERFQVTATFDEWSRLNFKFMNFARNSLLGEEYVACAILQPEIKTKRFQILGLTYYRTVSPTHTSILTDRELIRIREEALQNRKDNYGGIWDFIPLHKIAGISVRRENANLLTLCIKLLTEEKFECLFEESKGNEVERQVARFHELKSRSDRFS